MSVNKPEIRKKESLPASVKGASEVQSAGARLVVATRPKAVHEAAVGERRLHRNRRQQFQELPPRLGQIETPRLFLKGISRLESIWNLV